MIAPARATPSLSYDPQIGIDQSPEELEHGAVLTRQPAEQRGFGGAERHGQPPRNRRLRHGADRRHCSIRLAR